jgi:uncharacterized repeat protein (TIGR03803 family)
MNSNRIRLTRNQLFQRLRASFAIFTLTLLVTTSWAATEEVVHKFTGKDGAAPRGGVIWDAAGNLYGTTEDGGNASCQYGCGTVFELTPKAGGGWTEKVLYRFTHSQKDGHYPEAGLVFDSSGNLYGTTGNGGGGTCQSGCGTVFELTPDAGGGWTEKVLHRFSNNGKDGYWPRANLIGDASGNLYGTTTGGGSQSCTDGCGTVFELTPKAGGGWTEKVLHRFSNNGKDGYYCYGSLIFDSSGSLYGTTAGGGNTTCQYGCGTVFKLTPKADGKWTENVLYRFENNGRDAQGPEAGVIFDATGNLYGTSPGGGAFGYGTVFELKRNAHGVWADKVLFSFCSDYPWCTDGGGSLASVVFDSTGNLYGTTVYGGSRQCELGCGVVFELIPNTSGGWSEKVLYMFGTNNRNYDGMEPLAGLILDAAGKLYGTTFNGGYNPGDGMVFEIKP